MGEAVPCDGHHAGLRTRPDRQHDFKCPRRCNWRKGDLLRRDRLFARRTDDQAARGRRCHRLPVRVHRTPRLYGDAPRSPKPSGRFKGRWSHHCRCRPRRESRPIPKAADRLEPLQGAPSGRVLPHRTNAPPHRPAVGNHSAFMGFVHLACATIWPGGSQAAPNAAALSHAPEREPARAAISPRRSRGYGQKSGRSASFHLLRCGECRRFPSYGTPAPAFKDADPAASPPGSIPPPPDRARSRCSGSRPAAGRTRSAPRPRASRRRGSPAPSSDCAREPCS